MKCAKRMYLSVFWIVLGVVLTALAVAEVLDEFWCGMGCAFIAVGVLQLIRQIRYKKNENYREKVDIENGDERNRFIANKAWSWAGYLYVIIAAVATIALRIAGLDDYSTLVSGSMCLILVLYWGSYLYLKKKY